MPHPLQLRNVDKKEEEIIVSLFLSSICQDGGQRPISPDRPRLYICSAKQHPSSSRHPCWESYNIHFTVQYVVVVFASTPFFSIDLQCTTTRAVYTILHPFLCTAHLQTYLYLPTYHPTYQERVCPDRFKRGTWWWCCFYLSCHSCIQPPRFPPTNPPYIPVLYLPRLSRYRIMLTGCVKQ